MSDAETLRGVQFARTFAEYSMGDTTKARAAKHKPRATKEQRERAKEMFLAGAKHAEIAQALGVQHGTISAWCCKYGWRSLPEAPKTSKELDPQPKKARNSAEYHAAKALAIVDKLPEFAERRQLQEELMQIRGNSREEMAEYYQQKLAEVAVKFPLMLRLMPEPDLITHADKLSKLHGMFSDALGLANKSNAAGPSLIQLNLNAAPKPISGAEIVPDLSPIQDSTE